VKANNGHFLVSCDDVVPYGDGQKITLRIGNPYNITFNLDSSGVVTLGA